MATLNGSVIQRARVYLPAYGIWSARVSLAGSSSLTVGQRASLVVGDLTLSGTIRRGGTFVGETSFLVVGGADGWRRPARPRPPYRADNGVRTASVALDLASDVGEALTIEPGLAPFLGAAWHRDVQLASVLLSDICRRLVARSWMTPDGTMHLGLGRPVAELPAGLSFVVESFDPARGRATTSIPDDKIAAFQPGTMLRAPGLDPFVIGSVDVELEPGALRVHVDAHDPAEHMSAILATVTPAARLFGLYPYQVREQTGARLSCRALETVAGLPDQLLVDKAHGIAGASETCAPGSAVLVGFRGGSPAAPYVASYLPGTAPTSVLLDAQTDVKIGGAGAVALSKGGTTDSDLEALRQLLVTTATAAMVPPAPGDPILLPIGSPGGLPSTATTKAKGV